jgi:hypothetical protein
VVRTKTVADVDELHVLDGGCPIDPKGAWANVEENLNACEKRNHDQSWSPSRAVTSMACRQTTTIIDPAVRMVSTICELFFQVLKVILASVSVLSSPSVQADTRMDSRLRGNDGGGMTEGRGNDGGHGAVGSCTSGATMHVEVMPCSWSW